MTQACSCLLRPFLWFRRLYEWVLSFSERPHSGRALFVVALAEASFFPIPPDLLLVPLAIGSPRRAPWLATICTLGSVIGAILGYFLGLKFYEIIGFRVVEFYSAGDQYAQVKELYDRWDAIAVAVAGFTPIPFKVFTIAAGLFEVSFLPFLLAALVSRGARFFIVGGLIYFFGPAIQGFINRYFNILTVVFFILLIGGFVFIKYLI